MKNKDMFERWVWCVAH